MANLWSGKRVLIVDDEELIALDLSQQFEALGLTVCGTANTARDALIQAEASRPDLISMDINLGAPGEGIAAITLLRMSDLEHRCCSSPAAIRPTPGTRSAALGERNMSASLLT